MFTLSRDPLVTSFLCFGISPSSALKRNPNSLSNRSKTHDEKSESGPDDTRSSASSSTTKPFLITITSMVLNALKCLSPPTDVSFIISQIVTLFSMAWETIAYAWVNDLIQPDKHHISSSISSSSGSSSSSSSHLYYSRQYNNQTSSSSSSSSSSTAVTAAVLHQGRTKQRRYLHDESLSSSSSWGQFIDVDTEMYNQFSHLQPTTTRMLPPPTTRTSMPTTVHHATSATTAISFQPRCFHH